jgi:hypothetical protein
MRKVVLAIVLALGALAFNATPAFAQESTCAGEKYDVGELPVTTDDGIVISLVSDTQVHFDLPAGMTSATVCVKAGSDVQGNGPENTVITGDTTLTHSSGKEVSHVSIVAVVGGTTTTTTTGTGGPVDTTTTTTTGTGGPVDTTTTTGTGGPVDTTTGTGGPVDTTTTGGGGGGAGGAGGGGGGAAAPSGELPFTGLPILVPLLLGAALLGSGIVLLRRGRQQD